MTTQREEILILSGSLGDGHMQAAKAILEASAIYKPNVTVRVVDIMEWIHPRMHVIERYCFMQWVKHFPSLYGYLYQKTRADNPLTYLLKQFRTSSLHRLCRLIEDVNPTVLVSTFPPASAALSTLKEKGMTELLAVTIITDHSDHSYWIHPYTDLYLVGSEEVHMALTNKGVPDEKIAITGIPVRPVYTQVYDKSGLREKFGIASHAFVVLVMGGGWGMIDETFINQLQSENLHPNVQFIVICGRNKKIIERMQEATRGNENIQLKGFVENVHEWMTVSDVLVTKPGGLTTSEALALQLPMLLFEPLLGQERDNARYLVRKGVATICSVGQLQSEINMMAENPERLQKMRERAGECRHQNSGAKALTQVLKVSGNSIEENEETNVQYA